MTICSGKLNRQIDILSVGTTKNNYGEPISTASTQAGQFWADVKPISGTEYFAANQVLSESEFVFTIRYTTLITPDHSMIVRYNSQDYNIRAVINVKDEDIQYDLLCNRIAT